MKKGNFEIKNISDNIFYAKADGTFSEIQYKELIKKSYDLINCLDPHGYVIFIDAKNFKGSTPEAYKMYDQYNEWVNQNTKLLAKAILINEDINIKIKNMYLKSIEKQNIKYFYSEKEAWKWLNNYI